jgi:hypothetical protein
MKTACGTVFDNSLGEGEQGYDNRSIEFLGTSDSDGLSG